MWLTSLGMAITAGVATALLTKLAIKWAPRLGMVDHPDRHLKRHEKPTPYLGGAAVYLGFVLALAGGKIIVSGTVVGVTGVLASASLVVILGLIDDKIRLSPGIKFTGQILAAVALVACNMRIQFISPAWLAMLVSVFWVVAVTNAMNLIDIMDGLATGVGMTAAACFFIIAAGSQRYNDMYIMASLFGAMAGFLPHNFPKAKIYLGDTGALLLGFVLAAVAMGGGYSRMNPVAVLAPLLILGVPIFDTLFIMFIRHRKGASMFRGSPDHLALRMVRLGVSRKQTVLLLWAVSALMAASAWASTQLGLQETLFIYGGAVLAALFVFGRMSGFPMDTHP